MAILELTVLDHSGDTKVTWDSAKPVEVQHARDTFNSLRGRGYTAHSLGGKRLGKVGPVMREFDPEASGVLMVPQAVAG